MIWSQSMILHQTLLTSLDLGVPFLSTSAGHLSSHSGECGNPKHHPNPWPWPRALKHQSLKNTTQIKSVKFQIWIPNCVWFIYYMDLYGSIWVVWWWFLHHFLTWRFTTFILLWDASYGTSQICVAQQNWWPAAVRKFPSKAAWKHSPDTDVNSKSSRADGQVWSSRKFTIP